MLEQNKRETKKQVQAELRDRAELTEKSRKRARPLEATRARRVSKAPPSEVSE